MKTSKKPSALKSDKFTIYITPKGKSDNVPNVVLLYNNTGEQIGSIKAIEIPQAITSMSRILKALTSKERREWDNYYMRQ